MTNLLIALVALLAVITIARIVRILELVSDLSGEDDDTPITPKDNKLNATLMLWFMILGLAAMVYMTLRYSKLMLPVSASEHGVEVDYLFNVNMIIIAIVFFITQIMLFWFAFRYQHKKERKPLFYPDNHKLEFIWTIIPTIVLAGLIIYGLNVWNKVTAPGSAQAMNIEVYGKQFNWVIRYPGNDGQLGNANYNLVSPTNEMGVVSAANVDAQLESIKAELALAEETLSKVFNDEPEKKTQLEVSVRMYKTQVNRLLELQTKVKSDAGYAGSGDDDLFSQELYMPVGKEITLHIRSQDVIHSVYLPHFRVQMNAVPGMKTSFTFKPTITTDKMREITKNEKFDYVLLCNKICGVAHYNMKTKVVVLEEAAYNKWLKEQKNIFDVTAPAAAVKTETTPESPIALN